MARLTTLKGHMMVIGGTLKQKVYSDISTQKVVIEDAKHFAEYGNKVAKIDVIYLDKSEVVFPCMEH